MQFLILLASLCLVFHIQALKFDNPKSDILPSKEICGRQNCEAYPWLVHIPLESHVYNPSADLRCSGALISKRYIITRKSCLQFVLTKVHIGQYDTSTNVTCKNKPVLRIDIEERKVDDNSDIVLLRLAQDVEFGDDINPICLPFEDLKRAEAGQEVFSSGWGQKSFEDKPSKTMKKVKEMVITNEECKKSGIIDDANDKNVMCVKQADDSPDHACFGDGGSPIMFNNGEQWIVQGILTSAEDTFGKPCAVEKPARGVKITDAALQWIVDNMHA